MKNPQNRAAFTLLELLVVMGLIGALSLLVTAGLAHGGKSAAMQSAQTLMANMVGAARAQAVASGQSCRVLIQVDPTSASEPSRYLRYVVLQADRSTGWQTIADFFLPDEIYVVPGNFSALPAGLFATGGTEPWTKVDGSDLRSTALRSNQLTAETINGAVAETWVAITFSPYGGTVQSGDLVLTSGRRRPPGSFATGEAPIELLNAGNVRGLTLSAYGVPALVNTRTSF